MRVLCITDLFDVQEHMPTTCQPHATIINNVYCVVLINRDARYVAMHMYSIAEQYTCTYT